ncbi:MAG: lycopene cyclase domain-containing protein [Spirochaetia bacterium]|nr:lycopene cyclase domain-containing protein [Spirochaetia bacterium]
MSPVPAIHHLEYLLFNGLVLLFPLLFSFEKKISLWKKWRFVFPAIFLGSAPFLIWDLWAVGRHWEFNPAAILGPRLAGLPIEEWLFFLTVPYALLFVWENVKLLIPAREAAASILVPALIAQWVLLLAAWVFLFAREMEYLAVASTGLGLVLLLSVLVFRIRILESWRGMAMLVLFLALTLVANGYLTARPVVIYREAILTGLRVFRIPVEDFIFGLGHLILILTTYEYLLKRFSVSGRAQREKETS